MERKVWVLIPDGVNTRKIRSVASHVLSGGIIIGSLAAFGWVAFGAIQVTDSLAHIWWTPLAGAVVLQLVIVFALMFVWERLLNTLWDPEGNRERPFRSSLYTAYSRSWLARYIPGHIWSLGGRVFMANKLGVPVDVVTRSMLIEVIFTYVLVAIIGGALLLAVNFHILGGGALLVVGFVAFTASVPKSQKILNTSLSSAHSNSVRSKIRQRARKLITGDSCFTLPNTLWGVLVYGFYSCLQLGFIVLIAASFADLNLPQAAIIAGAWGVSLTLGWISFLAPVGLGVRDGLAFALFAPVLDAPTASLIVTTSRLIMLGVDLVFVGAVELLTFGLSSTAPRILRDCH
jgi:glycosyltransferase 2 family protein